MAAHSSILAWKIPWTEEAGRLQSMVSKELDMTEATQHTQLGNFHKNKNIWIEISQRVINSHYIKKKLYGMIFEENFI